MRRRADLRLWLIALAMLAMLIGLDMGLRSASEYGIADHQRAATAELVEAIQNDWRGHDVRWLAIVAIVGDLLFIGIYGIGAGLAGRSFLRSGVSPARIAGWFAIAAAAIFCVTDYVETILQFMQLLQDRGSQAMAATAAAMQVPKAAAFGTSFLAIVLGAILTRKPRPGA